MTDLPCRSNSLGFLTTPVPKRLSGYDTARPKILGFMATAVRSSLQRLGASLFRSVPQGKGPCKSSEAVWKQNPGVLSFSQVATCTSWQPLCYPPLDFPASFRYKSDSEGWLVCLFC